MDVKVQGHGELSFPRLEVFAGSARVTGARVELGLRMFLPWTTCEARTLLTGTWPTWSRPAGAVALVGASVLILLSAQEPGRGGPTDSSFWSIPVIHRPGPGGDWIAQKLGWSRTLDSRHCLQGANDGEPNQKPTYLMTNAPWVRAVLKLCPKNHVRGKPLRGDRAKRAGAYPWARVGESL